MNPLTLVKRIQSINSKEAELGISEDASWHAKYKDSAYVYAGGIPFDLTEGDLLAVFAQYGEIVDVNLVKDKGTGKSKGFAFVAYEDQRSTILAVDNLNGAQILGRTIRVDHVTKYKKTEEEDEETRQQKREERGVCRAFQKGECTRGDGCKFSHDEQRAANTGWGQREDKDSMWGQKKFDGPKKNENGGKAQDHERGQTDWRKDQITRRHGDEKYKPKSRYEGNNDWRKDQITRRHGDEKYKPKSRDEDNKEGGKSLAQYGDERYERKSEDHYKREEKSSRRHEDDQYGTSSREDRDKRDEKISKRFRDGESEPRSREECDRREDKRSRRHEDDRRR
ncbi:hypothetical protein ACFE04_015415 [Oxalis oulophora]